MQCTSFHHLYVNKCDMKLLKREHKKNRVGQHFTFHHHFHKQTCCICESNLKQSFFLEFNVNVTSQIFLRCFQNLSNFKSIFHGKRKASISIAANLSSSSFHALYSWDCLFIIHGLICFTCWAVHPWLTCMKSYSVGLEIIHCKSRHSVTRGRWIYTNQSVWFYFHHMFRQHTKLRQAEEVAPPRFFIWVAGIYYFTATFR